MKKKPQHLFPKNFYWGASTASHQVEGNINNDFSRWELANAKRLSKQADTSQPWLTSWKSLPIWPDIKEQAHKPENYISGKGVEHFKRYEEDFGILKKLNLNSFRFGIEWARLEPTEGDWDEDAITHYHTYIRSLKQKGIEPMLNIWHYTLPTWFADKGGFRKKKNLQYWQRYIQKLADEFGMEVTYIITLNEPNVYASFSYMFGIWTPEKRGIVSFFIVYYRLVSAHKQAYTILKKANPSLQIGIAQQVGNIQAKRPHNIIDQSVTKVMRYVWNWWTYNRINKHQDFIGFNYYFTDYYRNFKHANPTVPKNDLGWYMEPEGLYPILLRIWTRYKKPIFVTENGLADMNDTYRRWWLEETIVAMERAISEGVDLRGYYYWSLLDNFEWECGWWPKFGLVAVDRENDMKRTIRPSAKWFSEKIKSLSED